MKRGKPFKKGQSGNPSGRPKEDQAIKAFKETTYKDFISQLQKYGSLTRIEMATELQRPGATMFEIMFGQIVASAAKGDKDARNVLLERLWGKVKEVHEVTNPIKDELKNLSTSELLDIIRENKSE